MEREVVLCDEQGRPQGVCPILLAHQNGGQLHLAFSAFVFRRGATELLLQQRSAAKPIFANKWANTCCSHPFPYESVVKAGERRLTEELGFSCPLQIAKSFVYRADDPATDFSEYEHDTVLVGELTDEDTVITPVPAEVAAVEWMTIENIRRELIENPDKFAPWFPLALQIACP